MDIAATISAARKAAALSQEELARRTGLSYRTIWNIEQGGSVPRGATLRALAEALDLDLSSLVEKSA
jgi:transcriptional regulator with XRE-family HTH domain